MSANESKLYTFKEREWVVTGWAEGQMETEREDDKGQKVIVMAAVLSAVRHFPGQLLQV